jgi:hypothetical protein
MTRWGDIWVVMHSWWLQYSKNAGHCHLFTENLQQTYCSQWIVNSEPQLFWHRIFGGNLGEVEIMELNSSSDWLVGVLLGHGDIGNCWNCKLDFNSNFRLERLGLEVDNSAHISEFIHSLLLDLSEWIFTTKQCYESLPILALIPSE